MTRKPRKPKPLTYYSSVYSGKPLKRMQKIVEFEVDLTNFGRGKYSHYAAIVYQPNRIEYLNAEMAREVAARLNECADWLTSQKGKRG